MNELSEWLESWRPIRCGFEQLSLANPAVALCCWPFAAGELNACKRLDDICLEGIQENQFLMGLAGQEQIGSLHWWLLHESLARAAQREFYDHLPIGDELDRANRVCIEFRNHADHAGNLLAQAPKDRISIAEGCHGRKLWIKALFEEADQPPPIRIRTQPYRPLWAEVLDWPFEIKTLVENPFAASVILIDIIREAAGKDTPKFVPNTLQATILRALDGRALKKQPLANEVCGGEGSRLYRKGGIKELMALGKVANKPRLGYYRPDAPPP